MNLVTEEIAVALADAMNAKEDWEIPFVAKMQYVRQRNAAETKKPEVTVMPIRMNEQEVICRTSTDRSNPGKVKEVHTVGVILQKDVDDPNDATEVRPWARAIQSIADWARTTVYQLESEGNWNATYKTVELVIVGDALKVEGMFAGYAFIDFTVMR